MIGIYKITSPSNKVYIGQSRNIEKRFIQYKNNLAKGQKALNGSFLKYGHENHIFEIIEECSIIMLNSKERYYQDFYNAMGKNGLNLCLTETNLKPRVVSNYFRENLSERNKLRVWTEESKNKLASKQKINMIGNSYKKGFKHSDEFKENRRQIMIGNSNTLGLKQSEESRIKMSKNSTVKKVVLDTNTGVFYNSLIELSNLYGIKPNTLAMKLSGYKKNNTQFIYA
jgi:group I intron endonuclease